MIRWHWIRHGPTHARTFTGWRDVPADLTDKAALARLQALLPANAVVVSSDLARATATAAAIAGERVVWPPEPALREFDFGHWDGVGFAEVAASDPDLSRAFWERPGDVAAPGGESWNAVAARVGAFVDRVNAEARVADVVAVAHLGVILTQLARARNIAPDAAIGQPVDPLSLTELHWHGSGWAVARINHRP